MELFRSEMNSNKKRNVKVLPYELLAVILCILSFRNRAGDEQAESLHNCKLSVLHTEGQTEKYTQQRNLQQAV